MMAATSISLGVLLPPLVVVEPDANGVKTVVEYRIDDEGNKVKVTTITRVCKVRRSRRAIERRSWPKFGAAAKEAAGSRLTMASTEEIFDHTRGSGGGGDRLLLMFMCIPLLCHPHPLSPRRAAAYDLLVLQNYYFWSSCLLRIGSLSLTSKENWWT